MDFNKGIHRPSLASFEVVIAVVLHINRQAISSSEGWADRLCHSSAGASQPCELVMLKAKVREELKQAEGAPASRT